MSPAGFTATMSAAIVAAGIAGSAVVFLATRQEGFRRGYHWRVHLSDFGRSWTSQVLAPGSSWEKISILPLARGRSAAVAAAVADIDAR